MHKWNIAQAEEKVKVLCMDLMDETKNIPKESVFFGDYCGGRTVKKQ